MEGWELLLYAAKGDQSERSAGEMTNDFKGGKKSVKARSSIKTQILFCERVWHFLKSGTGRAAIVLPDGVLTNSSLQGVRDWLLARFQILAVVSLPHEAFQHSGAGVKASLVFLRKRAKNELPDEDEPIFMASPANIGYDATGRKTFKTTIKTETISTRIEIHSSDLFDVEVTYEKALTAGTGEMEWQERGRHVVSGTGVLGRYREFERRPADFFV